MSDSKRNQRIIIELNNGKTSAEVGKLEDLSKAAVRKIFTDHTRRRKGNPRGSSLLKHSTGPVKKAEESNRPIPAIATVSEDIRAAIRADWAAVAGTWGGLEIRQYSTGDLATKYGVSRS